MDKWPVHYRVPNYAKDRAPVVITVSIIVPNKTNLTILLLLSLFLSTIFL